jgi:hypothetical protein
MPKEPLGGRQRASAAASWPRRSTHAPHRALANRVPVCWTLSFRSAAGLSELLVRTAGPTNRAHHTGRDLPTARVAGPGPSRLLGPRGDGGRSQSRRWSGGPSRPAPASPECTAAAGGPGDGRSLIKAPRANAARTRGAPADVAPADVAPADVGLGTLALVLIGVPCVGTPGTPVGGCPGVVPRGGWCSRRSDVRVTTVSEERRLTSM